MSLFVYVVLLSHYLASTAGQAQTQGRQVVELGAGTGLPGLVAAHFARQVAVTDGNQVVVELVQKNVTALEANMDKKNIVCPVSASQCVWGDYAHLQALLETMVDEVDVVVAADVVQWPAVLEPLLHTVKALLWNSAADQPVFLVGIVNRAASTYNLFFQLATDLGFVCYMVESTEYLRDGEIPDQCREFGGRTTEIYRVTLEDRSIPPVLLQEQNVGDDTKDWTVGKSFEHTAFLPC
jgi:hypothetical protein